MRNRTEPPAYIPLALPGLELTGEQLGRPNSPLRDSVVTMLDALAEEGLLQPRHTAFAQLALELADAVTAGTRSGRASAAAMAAAQLRETLLALPAPSEGGATEEFARFVEAIANGKPTRKAKAEREEAQ